ncbi:MAG: hypothetical protein ABR519_05215 [Bacteroidales bacterium]
MKLLYNKVLLLLTIILLACIITDGTAAEITANDTTLSSRWIRIDSVNIPILPPSSGVTCYRDGIIFLSSTKQDDIIPENHISFGKPETMFTIIMDGKPVKASLFSPSADFSFPGDAITFTGDYKTMYYTRFDRIEGYERIYRGDFTEEPGGGGYWTLNHEPLPFCTGSASYTHPALSADGKLMIFASNRQATLGGMDLFVTILKDGKWSEPVNMGDAVNSVSNELYPYLDRENNLYFSSDGIQGFGGYDIFMCRFRSNTWEKPTNLLPPVNTRWDDIAFTIDCNSGKRAFYTVRQNKGKRSQQLHMISLNKSIPDTLINLSQYFSSSEISSMVILALEPAVQATNTPEEDQTAAKITPGSGDSITYRVQFMTSFNPRTRAAIDVNDKNYNVYEFLYAGAYRLCVGEYSDLSKAVELQNLLRQNSFPGASVLAFVNNELSLDPELLTAEAAGLRESVQKKLETARAEEKAEVIAAKQVVKEEAKKEETAKVIYRVQIVSHTTPKGSYKVTIGTREYNTWEYKHAGAWRATVGEFSTLTDAIALQRLARQSGFDQAFVAAFRNGERSTDPGLFK